MNGVGPATAAFDAGLLHTPGAFAWWYVDLVDPSGNGAVLLWAFGLPFLPGSSDPSGPLPCSRPTVSLAVYEDGRAAFYLLQNLDPASCSWDGDGRWDMERSRIVRRDGGGRVEIDAALDLTLPGGGSAGGSLHFRGPLRQGGSIDRDPVHSWEPVSLGGATAELSLVCDTRRFDVRGRAYHDRNVGTLPLGAQGIRSWRWGRVSLPETDLVFYWVEPTTELDPPRVRLFEADGTGRLVEHTVHAVTFAQWRRSRLGQAWPARIAIDSSVGTVVLEQGAPLDDGPFYLRSPLSVVVDGRRGVGFSEHVRVDRLDRAIDRPFVNMRVHATRGPNSIWLPLFSGPRVGRLRRFLGRGGSP